MNLELLIVFGVFSLIIIFLGYFTKPEIKVLAVLGFTTLFFLGMLLQFGGVTQRVGDLKSLSYSNGTLVSESVSYNEQVIDDSTSVWVGRWTSIVSMLGAVLVFTSNKKDEGDD